MDSQAIAFKAPVQACIPGQDGSASYQYIMDLSLDQDGSTFHCRFRTNAYSGKRAFVYLFLDVRHVQSLELCDVDEAIPPGILHAFGKRASDVYSDDIMTLRFCLRSHAPLIAPDATLQRRPATCEDLEALLRVGQCEMFKIYVLSSAINRDRLSNLCSALVEGVLQPAPEGVISSAFVHAPYRRITHVDQLWSSNLVGTTSPLEYSKDSGASNPELAGPSKPTLSRDPRGHGKRRSVSPDLLQNPSKRQLLTEKATAQPWELAISVQAAQIAALSAEVSKLRQQVKQLQRAPAVDPEIQTKPTVEHIPGSSEADSELSHESPSEASTVKHTIDDRSTMLEQEIDAKIGVKLNDIDEKFEDRLLENEMNITDEGTLRERLDQRLVQRLESNEEQLLGVEMFQYLEYDRLESNIDALATRVTSLNNNLGNDLRRNFNEALEKQKLDLQAKMKEVVKQDVRKALENGKVKFEFDFGRAETESAARA